MLRRPRWQNRFNNEGQKMRNIDRRTFLGAAAIFPIVLGQASALQESDRVVHVEHGADRFNQQRTIAGANQIAYKVSSRDTKGGLFLFEQVSLRKGGPPRHLHHNQEEWFYVISGEYVFEVGEERIRLRPGDSLLAPRRVPHVWAYVGEMPGKILIGFQPAGKMETFFEEAAKISDFAADEKLYRACEMEIVGPPLSLGYGG
jgi:mannose-6-phosphate isomerase-like protein (cupin superfamily)